MRVTNPSGDLYIASGCVTPFTVPCKEPFPCLRCNSVPQKATADVTAARPFFCALFLFTELGEEAAGVEQLPQNRQTE